MRFDLDFGEIVAQVRAQRTSVVVFRLRDARPARVLSRLEHVLEESASARERGAVISVDDGRHRVR